MLLSAAVRNGKEDGAAAAFDACDFPEGFGATFFRFGISSSSESRPETERADDRDVERRSPSEGMEARSESLASSGTIKSSSSLVGLRFLSVWGVNDNHGKRGARKRIHGTLFWGDFLNFKSFSVNTLFPIAVSSFSSGSSDGALEIRRFFVLLEAFARVESLSSGSCTEIFRLIRCDAEFNGIRCCRGDNMSAPS